MRGWEKIAHFCIFFILLGYLEAAAQQNCGTNGGFLLARDAPCDGRVTVTNTVSGASQVEYCYNYQSGVRPIFTPVAFYTYTTPGKYRVFQRGILNGDTIRFCRDIEIFESRTPDFSVASCGRGQITVLITADEINKKYDHFEVDLGDGSSQYVFSNGQQPISATHQYGTAGTYQVSVRGRHLAAVACEGSAVGVKSVAVTLNAPQLVFKITGVELRDDRTAIVTYDAPANMRTELLIKRGNGAFTSSGLFDSQGGTGQRFVIAISAGQTAAVRLRLLSPCEGNKDSEPVGIVEIGGKALSERNVISWNKYEYPAGFLQYNVFRDGLLVLSIPDINKLEYTDSPTLCGVPVNYQVRVQLKSQCVSISPVKAVVGLSNGPPGVIEDGGVTVHSDGSVAIRVLPGSASGTGGSLKVLVERKEEGIFQDIGFLDINYLLNDTLALADQQSRCYRFISEDACGNKSEPSDAVCTIWLSKQGRMINWSEESPFLSSVEDYLIQRSGPDGALVEIPVGEDHFYRPTFVQGMPAGNVFSVRAQSELKGLFSESNRILFNVEPRIMVPEAFSPDNGDQVNGEWKVVGFIDGDFSMRVFNRWGEVVFQSSDWEKGWDGRINGVPAAEGQYAYRVEIRNGSSGKSFLKTGSVHLIR